MRKRGFEVVSNYASKNILLPKRQTKYSAGYDLAAAEQIELHPHKITIVPTGLKAYMSGDEYLAIFIRSSLAIRHGLSLANSTGIIDADYYDNPQNEGHILLAIYNNDNRSAYLKEGERVAQGIFTKYLVTDDDTIEVTGRIGGIGSTGK